MSNLKIYCVTNKRLDLLESYSYKFGWVGKDKVPENYIRCDDKENIKNHEYECVQLNFKHTNTTTSDGLLLSFTRRLLRGTRVTATGARTLSRL